MATNPAEDSCAMCRFFVRKPEGDSINGTCHRYPPTVSFVHSTLGVQPAWTPIPVNEWCGEFKEND